MRWPRSRRRVPPIARCAVACALTCGAVCTSRPAFADDYAGIAAEAPAPNPTEARARYRSGAAAYSEGRYKDAIDLFLEANQLDPSPALSYNIARAYEKLGDTSNALSFYREYLRRAVNADDKEQVQRSIEQLSQRLEKRGVQQVTILSSPRGATLSIDGKPVGVTPWTFELRPGLHHLTLSLRGYADVERDFRLWPEIARDVTVSFTEDASAKADAPANDDPDPRAIALEVRKSTEIAVPSQGPAAATGTAEVAVAGEAKGPSTPTTALAKTDEPTVVPPPEPAPRIDQPQRPPEQNDGTSKALTTWGIVALSAGGAALAGSLTFEILRHSAENDAENAKTQQEYASDYNTMKDRQTASRILLGTGAALAVTGGVLLFFGLKSKPKQPATAWSFGCDGHGCSAAVHGRF